MKESAWRIARLFAWLGAVSFGGPLAHIALMQREIVEKRGWVSRQEFLDLSGAMSLIPGPNSTELAMALGRKRGGSGGLWAAGISFILPAFCIVLALAVIYARVGQFALPRAMLYGVQPVVIAIIVMAGAKLLPTAAKDWATRAIAMVAFVVAVAGWASELMILAAAALIGLALGFWKARGSAAPPQVLAQVLGGDEAPTAPKKMGGAMFFFVGAGASTWGPWGQAWWLLATFLKIGSILYGSGYVLLAFLRDEFVPKYLSDAQLLDAVAIGQVTPGPVFTTATFIGFLLGGLPGAIAATIGIFLPSFLLVAWLLKVLDRVQGSPVARRFLDAVNAASLALMGAVALQLGRAAVVDSLSAIIAVASLIILARTKVNSAWLIGAGALAGAMRIPVAGMMGL